MNTLLKYLTLIHRRHRRNISKIFSIICRVDNISTLTNIVPPIRISILSFQKDAFFTFFSPSYGTTIFDFTSERKSLLVTPYDTTLLLTLDVELPSRSKEDSESEGVSSLGGTLYTVLLQNSNKFRLYS